MVSQTKSISIITLEIEVLKVNHIEQMQVLCVFTHTTKKRIAIGRLGDKLTKDN